MGELESEIEHIDRGEAWNETDEIVLVQVKIPWTR